MTLTYLVLATAALVVLGVLVAVVWAFCQENTVRELYEETLATGMSEVPSLHPVVDQELCIASGSCVDSCPEDVLGQLSGRTVLVQPGSCIGHGRCHASCPVDAITLVFGTAKRGVDIPLLRRGLETNKDGIFVAGELGGMGLLRNTMRQGQQVVESILERLDQPARANPDVVDVLIVGAGPAGIACALKCRAQNLTFKLMDQYKLGGSVTHYPRRKLIHSETIELPLVGAFGKSEMLKEELIAEFERVCLQAKIEVLEERRVEAIEGAFGDFRARVVCGDASQEVHRGRVVVLAIGRRGTPRKLGVPGEDSGKVVYKILEPEIYRHKKVLVVGGGDSAVESAIAVSKMAGAEVHLSYRNKAFFRVKKQNRDALEQAVAKGEIKLHLETNVLAIGATEVALRTLQGEYKVAIDDVIVSAGGVLPTPFLEAMGVEVETKHGEAVDLPNASDRLAKSVAKRIASASTRLSASSRRFGTRGLSGRLKPGSGSEPDASSKR